MDALSFNRSRQRWQLQLPDEQNITGLSHDGSTRKVIKGEKSTPWIDLWERSVVGEGLKSVTHPPVVPTWGGWGSTCDILDHSHHRTGAGPGKTHQRSVLWPRSSGGWGKVHSRRSPRFHTCCSTCTLCTASGTSSQPPSWWEWTADRRGGLHAEVDIVLKHLQSFGATQRWGPHLSARSRSRTPALLTGQSCGWFWSHPSRSHSNY